MTPEQITAYIQAGALLVNVGGLIVGQIRDMYKPLVKTEEELNHILKGVELEDRRRAALARADSGE